MRDSPTVMIVLRTVYFLPFYTIRRITRDSGSQYQWSKWLEASGGMKNVDQKKYDRNTMTIKVPSFSAPRPLSILHGNTCVRSVRIYRRDIVPGINNIIIDFDI